MTSVVNASRLTDPPVLSHQRSDAVPSVGPDCARGCDRRAVDVRVLAILGELHQIGNNEPPTRGNGTNLVQVIYV